MWKGFIIDFSAAFNRDSERSLALEPPIISTLSITLTTNSAPTAVTSAGYFVPEFDPDDYGIDDVRPGYRNEWILGTTSEVGPSTSMTFDIGPQTGLRSSTTAIAGSAFGLTFDPSVNIGAATINSDDTGDYNANWGRLQSYIQNSQWSGKVAITLLTIVPLGERVNFNSNEAASGAPVITVTENSFHSGQIGVPMRKRTRVRHDPKSGFPGLTDEFIKDGYREGMMVLPESWDPEDRTNMDFFPPPSEGVVDDEVA
jgi:hypothetical protein